MVIVMIFLLKGCLPLGSIVSRRCVNAWLSGGTCFAVEPEVFLNVDRGVYMIMKMGDARLSIGNGCTKKEVSRSVLIFA